MVYTLVSGTSGRKAVEVQVLSRAPRQSPGHCGRGFVLVSGVGDNGAYKEMLMRHRAVLLSVIVAVAGLGALALMRGGLPLTNHRSAQHKDSSRHTAIDTSFAQKMVAHHDQALEMAALADTKAASSEVKAFAQKIKGAQEPEITKMKGWLSAWGERTDIPTSADPGMGGHDMGAHVEGMMTHEEMQGLGRLSGPAFDRAWLQMMIRHHEGAVEMARTQQQIGQYGPAKDLARSIQDGQTREIEQMRKLLAG